MQRKDAPDKYKWDFSDLYKDFDAWKADLKRVQELGDEFKSFKGKLNKPEEFKKYLQLEDKIDHIVNKMVIYLRSGDVDTADTRYQELEGLLTNVFQKINVETSFIAPELKAVGEKTIMGWIDADKDLAKYKLGYKNFFEEAKHILDTHDETLLSQVSRSRGAIGGMYETLAFADRKEPEIEYEGKTQPLTESLYMHILEDSDPIKDQQLRLKAAKLYGAHIKDNKNSFASIYEGIMIGELESVQIRHYKSIIESNLQEDKVPVEVYKKLIEVGKNNTKVFKDYNELIKKHFGFKKFYTTDRSLKLVKNYNRTFDVEQSKKIVREAVSVLGKDYLKQLDIAWGPHRIDFYPDTNKVAGGYQLHVDGVLPIILINWNDKFDSINTLAHESGHSVHSLFATEYQPYPLNSTPIILAEVASTLNEHLLFDYMYKNAKSNDEKIYLLQQRIDNLIGTFYRQIQFADFEMQAHEQVEKGIPQTSDSLGSLFYKLNEEYGYDMFDSEHPEKKKSFGWPAVGHFFRSPFYVYKYALDITASYKLFGDIKKGNINTTLNFLKEGSSKESLDVLKDAGIDFSKEETYKPLIKAIEDMVKELEGLLNEN